MQAVHLLIRCLVRLLNLAYACTPRSFEDPCADRRSARALLLGERLGRTARVPSLHHISDGAALSVEERLDGRDHNCNHTNCSCKVSCLKLHFVDSCQKSRLALDPCPKLLLNRNGDPSC